MSFFIGEKMKKCNVSDTENQFYCNKNDFLYLNLAIKKAKMSFVADEVPVGAVLVFKNNVVSDFNNKERTNLPTSHAEINVINKMCMLVKNWRLNGATLYVTMAPCLMCIGAILEARISKVVFGCDNNINNKYLFLLKERGVEVVGPVNKIICGNLISEFFKEKR